MIIGIGKLIIEIAILMLIVIGNIMSYWFMYKGVKCRNYKYIIIVIIFALLVNGITWLFIWSALNI